VFRAFARLGEVAVVAVGRAAGLRIRRAMAYLAAH